MVAIANQITSVSWAQLNPHLNLEYELHDTQYIPIAEPNEPMFENNDGEMDIYKVLTESYGSNNRGPSYYYYMHGGWSVGNVWTLMHKIL